MDAKHTPGPQPDKRLEKLAYQLEQQGQGANPILNAAAKALRQTANFKHRTNAEIRDLRYIARERDSLREQVRTLREALTKCEKALMEEVNAAGDDDHPTINSHSKVAEQARAVLERTKG